MERDFISIEDIITSAQDSLNDIPIVGRFLITSVIKKIASNDKPYYRILLKYKTRTMKAIRFTNGKSEFELLSSIYFKGNIIEIEGIYQCDWKNIKILNENLIENFKESSSREIQDKNLENILNKKLTPLKEEIKLGTTIQLKLYVYNLIKSIFDNLSSRKIKQLKKSFEQEIEGLPMRNREEFCYYFAEFFKRYEIMQPSKWKKWGSHLIKLISILR